MSQPSRASRTVRAIGRAAHELFAIDEEQALAVLLAPGEQPPPPPAERLVGAGLLSESQVDAVLERAFASLQPAGEETSPPNNGNGNGNGNGHAGPVGLSPDELALAGEVEGLPRLLERLDDILAGRVQVGLPRVIVAPPPVAHPGGSLPPAPGRLASAPHAAGVPPTAEGTLVGVAHPGQLPAASAASWGGAPASTPSAPAIPQLPVEPPPEDPSPAEALEWLNDQAFLRWAVATQGVTPEAIATARARENLAVHEALIVDGALDLSAAMDALDERVDLVCGACEARFALGPCLHPYALACACPQCRQPLGPNAYPADGGAGATQRPGSVTGMPAYAAQDPGGGTLRMADPLSATGLPDYAQEDRTIRAPTGPDLAQPASLTQAPGYASNPGEGVAGLEKYEIEKELARGGMGIVYKARQKGLGRTVCVKVLRDAGLAGEEDRRRFLREAEACARLNHPNIVPIHDVGEHRGMCYFSMEFIDGKELGHYVRDHSPEVAQVVRVMIDVCRAIHYAHQRGIIHRDLKPANVMVDAQAKPHVMDFGIAKTLDTGEDAERGPMTREGEIMGTPHYMAPEQAEGKVSEIDVRTDVYALGVICYELFTGQRPFQDENIINLLKQVSHSDPRSLRVLKPELDPDLETIVLKAMEKEKRARYQTAQALQEELQRWVDGEPIQARRATVLYRWKKWARRNRTEFLIACVGAAGVFLVSGLWGWARVDGYLAAQRAVSERVERAADAARRARYDEAFAIYGEVMIRDPAHAGARAGRVQAALALGRAHLDRRDPSRAVLILEQVAHLDEEYDRVQALLARAREEEAALREASIVRQEEYRAEAREVLRRIAAHPRDRPLSFDELTSFVIDLVRVRDPVTVALLRAELIRSDADLRVRGIAARALGAMGAVELAPTLVDLLADAGVPGELRVAAAEGLSRLGGSAAFRAIRSARQEGDAAFRLKTDRAWQRVARYAPENEQGLEAALARADGLLREGRWGEAREAFRACLQQDPRLADAYLGLATAAISLSRLAEAREALDRFIDAGSNPVAGYLNRAEVSRLEGDFPGALADLARLFEFDPEHAKGRLKRGRVLHAQARESDPLDVARAEEALAAMDRALELSEGGLARAHAARALVLGDLARLDEALAAADAAVNGAPDQADMHLVRAGIRAARAEWAVAAVDAREAVRLAPGHAPAHRELGWILSGGGQVDEAVTAYRAGATRCAAPGLALQGAVVLLEAERWAEARQAAEELLSEELPDKLAAAARQLRGIAALRLGEPEAALADLEPLAADSSRWEAHYNLACALARAERSDEAVKALARALELAEGQAPDPSQEPDLEPLRELPAFRELISTEEEP